MTATFDIGCWTKTVSEVWRHWHVLYTEIAVSSKHMHGETESIWDPNL